MDKGVGRAYEDKNAVMKQRKAHKRGRSTTLEKENLKGVSRYVYTTREITNTKYAQVVDSAAPFTPMKYIKTGFKAAFAKRAKRAEKTVYFVLPMPWSMLLKILPAERRVAAGAMNTKAEALVASSYKRLRI